MTMTRAMMTFFVLASLGGAGCVQEIDQAVDCANLCGRYADCYDSSYDRGACRDRCNEFVDNDERAANDCDTCLDDRACTESFACSDECFGLLP